MKTWILMIAMICVASAFAEAQVKIYSFKEWKGEKIQGAVAQTLQVRTQLLKAKSENNALLKTSLEKQLEQASWHLDVAKDLSVTDYFVLYLSPLSQPERFQVAAQKLSTAEIAELMKAYADELAAANPTLPPATDRVTNRVNTGPKLPIQATQN